MNYFTKPPKVEEIEEFVAPLSPYGIARKEMGVMEINGSKHNKRIQEYLAVVGLPNYSDETAWCSAFVNWCCKEAGAKITGRANARSFLTWGEGVMTPKEGDVVVLWRVQKNGWQGHVGFYVKHDDESIWILGGNQNNEVNVMKYPKRRLLGYRRMS